jgi:hypothetical protein
VRGVDRGGLGRKRGEVVTTSSPAVYVRRSRQDDPTAAAGHAAVRSTGAAVAGRGIHLAVRTSVMTTTTTAGTTGEPTSIERELAGGPGWGGVRSPVLGPLEPREAIAGPTAADPSAVRSSALRWLGDHARARRVPDATRLALAVLSWWCRGARLGVDERDRLWQFAEPHEGELTRMRIDSLLYWACEIDAPVQHLYDRVQVAQSAAAVRAVAALVGADIDVLVCKGGELVPRLVGGRGLHAAKDTDLLVGRPQLGRARRVLLELAYQQVGLDRATGRMIDLDPLEMAASERGHYELYPFRALVDLDLTAEERAAARLLSRGPAAAADGTELPGGPLWGRLWVGDDDRTRLAVEIDLHFRLAHEWDVDRLFARAVPSCLGVGRTLSPTDHLWFGALRYYFELDTVQYRQLRPLALLGRLVSAPDIDWTLACRVAAALHSAPALYYVLGLIERLAPGRVPADVLADLDPTRVDRRYDHGWRLARMFGFLDPFPLEP